MYNLKQRVTIEAMRTHMNETMAELFEQVDFVMAPTTVDVAFGKKGPFPTTFNGVEAGAGNNGALTIPSNIYGNPAISVPAGTVHGMPVGLQVLTPHHREPMLLDLSRSSPNSSSPGHSSRPAHRPETVFGDRSRAYTTTSDAKTWFLSGLRGRP